MAAAGRYKALRKIASGGTADVFLAEQVGAAGFRRLVVLKRIREALYADATFRRMLVEEAHVAMGLHHSNLVEVLDLGEAQGRYFLVLELVDGWTLQQLLERSAGVKQPLAPAMALYVCAEVCRALAYAHNRTRGGVPLNIVHRDVCPNNVLVSEMGEVKLTDFGIAKARTRTRESEIGTVAGKPSYMSPEQACGEALDARSDLFSVGTLLYYLLTAQLPFRAASDRELMIRVASGEFVSPAKLNPSLPKDVVKLVLKAMQRQPSERFQSAQEMLTALEKVQRDELAPFGRSELEAWLRALAKADGRAPLTRESMVPQTAPKEEWIELSSQELEALETVPRKRRWWPVVVGLIVLGAGGELARQRLMPKRVRPKEAAPLVANTVVPLPVAPLTAQAPAVDAGAQEVLSASAIAETAPDAGAAPTAQTVPEPMDAAVVAAVAAADSAQAPPDAPPARAAVTPNAIAAAEPTPAVADVPPKHSATTPSAPASPSPAPSAAAFPPAPGLADVLPALKVRAWLAPPPKDPMPKDRAAVQLETDPPGAAVVVDHHSLGNTPVALRFKLGVTFEVTFEREGFTPVVEWLTLVERPDRPPRVSLRPPPPH